MNRATDRHSDAYWVGRLSATIVVALKALAQQDVGQALDQLDRELHTFLASPVASEELRRVLREL